MNKIPFFICPVCKAKLKNNSKSLICDNGHCFDLSKYGYVNLLLSQKSSALRHGDDKLMIVSRRDFLDSGYYKNLSGAISDIALSHSFGGAKILDAGSGEGYYLSSVSKLLKERGLDCFFGGIDISKDALRYACARVPNADFAVASVFDMPVKSDSTDIIFNLFSPEAFAEFYRALKKDGILIRVVPLENHLFSLKKAIYDTPYKNEPPKKDIDGFTLINETELKSTITIENGNDIENLFKMTPYYYKTGKNDQDKIKNLDFLETETEFGIYTYKKS